jgi:hypothetical protein
MILSCGVSGAFLLNVVFHPIYLLILVPLLFAGYVSYRDFYRSVISKEEAYNLAKIE